MRLPAAIMTAAFLCAAAAPGLAAAAKRGAVRLMQTERALADALKQRNVGGLVAGLDACAQEDTLDALQVILKYYAATEDLPDADVGLDARFRLFTAAARGVARLADQEALIAVGRLAVAEKHWAARYLLAAAARANPKIDTVKLGLEILKSEKDPRVVVEAVRTLGVSRKKEAIVPLIDYWEGLEKKMGRAAPTVRSKGKGAGGYRTPEWDRVPVALQDALARLCGRVLTMPALYRSYYSAHGAKIDPTKPVETPAEGRSVIFGLDITGKNIAFVLDISGSMTTTDPLPLDGGPRPRSVRTKDGVIIDENRERIFRAKEELVRVIRDLPDDKSFNIIAYSSDVKPWQGNLVPADAARKRQAIDFVEGLKADGITVTDLALEYAFEDPIVDTIYLITDGAPTHQGSVGPGLPSDAPRLIKEILARVKVLNFRRGVRIFTLGFPGAEEEFLRTLSQEHNGKYRPIR
ncbi:MAG TPA: VWA domain-containing protein [Planctomycetota bacterium]|mgnify:CR=1 FL=1|jgi:hypothetical protein|nr:VWA domain-containing protein [Planctomycetota bacterium]OQC22278.1 MAG: von Willebrand factor type A domain protein [Planctomycetes bacterium ADurb.Bin069]NMD35523.1 VWA domain-containing protein [Planctomycetota bacterium]HNS00161.1 VWA domain-containing protein [Planctomycetota bacterium]HNU25887.1 VWA domain-containing protein [Planctomycetota bacterium]